MRVTSIVTNNSQLGHKNTNKNQSHTKQIFEFDGDVTQNKKLPSWVFIYLHYFMCYLKVLSSVS